MSDPRTKTSKKCCIETAERVALSCEAQLDRLRDENVRLRAALEHLSLYVAVNGDDWVQKTARDYLAGSEPPRNETSERQPAVALLLEVLENISTVKPLEHFPAVTALAYCRKKAIEALKATREFQEVIVGEYEADGKINMASSPLPEGTKLYARLPLRHSEKADPQHGAKARDFVEYDSEGGVRIDLARYLRTPAGQAQLQALGGKKANPCSCGHDGRVGPGHQTNCPQYREHAQSEGEQR